MTSHQKPEQNPTRKRPPGTTLEAREKQLVALAVDVAEQQLRAGTASSQVISHFLRLGSTTERDEREIRRQQAELMKAKTESIQSAKRVEELYKDAMKAFSSYVGNPREDDDGDD